MRSLLEAKMDDMVYADNAATTMISKLAFEKMLPFLREQYGNPSSLYKLGTVAKKAVEYSRMQVARAIDADPSEIIFTSGGSEVNSWIIKAVERFASKEPVHIIASVIEHHSVLNSLRAVEEKGILVTYLPVDAKGRVSISDVSEALRPNTKIVSMMTANNEIGTLQPIVEIGGLLRDKSVVFHTDAVQAVGHIPVSVKEFGVDFLTASAHKFNGPKGVGFLYKRSGLELPPLLSGGGQENSMRAGTENVAGIVGLGYALEENCSQMKVIQSRLSELAQKTVDGLRKSLPSVIVNGDDAVRLPGFINVAIPGVGGEELLHLLDLKGICVSTSSACNSGKKEPSHVLLALGQSEEIAKSAIRISYGKYSSQKDVDRVVDAIVSCCSKIAAIC